MNKLKYYIFIILAVLSSNSFSQIPDEILKADKKNPDGKEFWLCFMRNHNDPVQATEQTILTLQLFITSDKDANVTVEIQSIGFKETVFVRAGTVVDIKIDPRAQIKSSEVIEENAAVHIVADVPVIVYGLNRRRQTTDTFMALPVNVVGTQYRVMCYDGADLFPEFAIVATEDSTKVSITPTVETFSGHEPNLPFTVILNKGDVYQVSAKALPFSNRRWDLTGSLIASNKKISVFSGHQCAYVPNKDVIACNHLVEQMPPLSSWGKQYYVGSLFKRKRYSMRVLANKDDTKVFINAKLVKVLSAGEYYEQEATDNLQVSASNPVLVAQFSQGFSNGDKIGDPMMMLISPTQQFLTKYRFTTPVKGFWDHYVNLVVPSSAIQTLKIDGRAIDSSRFKKLGESRYSISYIKVDYGTRELSCAEPFGMSIYGFGYDKDQYDAYGTIGGQSFIDYVDAKDTLAPYVQLTSKNNLNTITIREDRPFDSGIKAFTVLDNSGFLFNVPSYDVGLPQLFVGLKLSKENIPAKAVIKMTDEAGNSCIYTLCYNYDSFAGKFVISLNEGEKVNCVNDPEFYYGAYLMRSYTSHSANFTTANGLKSLGTTAQEQTQDKQRWGQFGDAFASSGWIGILLAKRFSAKTVISARMSLETMSGILESPDKEIQQYRNPMGELTTFHEGRKLSISGLSLNIGAMCEYYLSKNFYVSAGLEANLLTSKSVDYKRNILYPVDYLYSNGEREIDASSNLDALRTLTFGGSLGLGFTYPITNNLAPFIEINQRYKFSSIINDGNWNISNLSILLGARFTISSN